MSETLHLSLSAVAGLALGVFFFGGLWLTVRKVVSSQRHAAWLLVGGLLRMGVALSGFYVVAGGQWQRLLACLAGFFIARLAVTWLTRIPASLETAPAAESGRAP